GPARAGEERAHPAGRGHPETAPQLAGQDFALAAARLELAELFGRRAAGDEPLPAAVGFEKVSQGIELLAVQRAAGGTNVGDADATIVAQPGARPGHRGDGVDVLAGEQVARADRFQAVHVIPVERGRPAAQTLPRTQSGQVEGQRALQALALKAAFQTKEDAQRTAIALQPGNRRALARP